MKHLSRGLFLSLLLSLLGCGKAEKFDAIDLNMAGPIDVATSQDGKYFYVLNSDFDRTYDHGSILVIDEDGKKLNSIEVPRLGRHLNVVGTDLIVTFDREDDDSTYEIHLYDLSEDNAEKPKLVKRWTGDTPDLELNCIPISSVMRKDYKYFAVTCFGGKIFLGTFGSPRSKTTLKLVRDYSTLGRTRRALYLDPARELLLAFSTDFSQQDTTDLLTRDEFSCNKKAKCPKGANEIPDQFEDSTYRQRNTTSARYRYQFVVYDIASEEAKGFPFRSFDDPEDDVVPLEQRWLYFTLKDWDETYDTSAQTTNMKEKHYRTNFWSAQPDPLDPNSFYLSHRGKNSKASRYANNIVRVTFTGDPEDFKQSDPIKPTSQLFTFKRVFGFSGELDEENHFPGEFRVLPVNGRVALVVNHFKDLVNFRKDAAYTISAKLLDGSSWSLDLSSTSTRNSYYQVAVNERGKILTCAFYGNAVIPLELIPGADIKVGWGKKTRIE